MQRLNGTYVNCIGLVINSTNWYLQLDISDVNDEIQKAVEIIENRYRSEDILLSNVSRLISGSPVHGQLIDSMPSKDGHSGSRNAEIILEVTRSLKNTYCLKYLYKHKINISIKIIYYTCIIIIICTN